MASRIVVVMDLPANQDGDRLTDLGIGSWRRSVLAQDGYRNSDPGAGAALAISHRSGRLTETPAIAMRAFHRGVFRCCCAPGGLGGVPVPLNTHKGVALPRVGVPNKNLFNRWGTPLSPPKAAEAATHDEGKALFGFIFSVAYELFHWLSPPKHRTGTDSPTSAGFLAVPLP